MKDIRRRATQGNTPRQEGNYVTEKTEFQVLQKVAHLTLSAEGLLFQEREAATDHPTGEIQATLNVEATAKEKVMEKAEGTMARTEAMEKEARASVAESLQEEISEKEKEGQVLMEMTKEEVSAKEDHHQEGHSMMAEEEALTTGEGNSEPLQESLVQDASRTALLWE